MNRRKGLFWTLYNELANEDLDNVNDFIQNDSQDENRLANTEPAKMSDIDLLFHKLGTLTKNHADYVKQVALRDQEVLNQSRLARLFGFKSVFNKDGRDAEWIVLTVPNNRRRVQRIQ